MDLGPYTNFYEREDFKLLKLSVNLHMELFLQDAVAFVDQHGIPEAVCCGMHVAVTNVLSRMSPGPQLVALEDFLMTAHERLSDAQQKVSASVDGNNVGAEDFVALLEGRVYYPEEGEFPAYGIRHGDRFFQSVKKGAERYFVERFWEEVEEKNSGNVGSPECVVRGLHFATNKLVSQMYQNGKLAYAEACGVMFHDYTTLERFEHGVMSVYDRLKLDPEAIKNGAPCERNLVH
jgi:hypothetical protein